MYSGYFEVTFPHGLHGETLYAIGHHFPSGMVLLNGVDVSDMQSRHLLYGEKQVTATINTGDPQQDRDVFDIVRGIANSGHNPWPGKTERLPPALYSKVAEWMRARPEFGLGGSMEIQSNAHLRNDMQSSFIKGSPGKEHMKGVSPKRNRQYEHIKKKYLEKGLPEDEAKELAARTVNKQRAEKGETKETDSDKLSRWTVVSLGELQQPSAVGIQEDHYNRLLDGPNPEGPNFNDNSQNSFEHQVALQTWVNHAVHLLNKGNDPEVVLAQLAHDGCPEPTSVLNMALQREEQEEPESAVTDQIGQDPFEVPFNYEDSATREDVFRQPAVQAKTVRIVGSSLTGVELDRWEDLWGQGIVKVALDDGGVVHVAPSAVEEINEAFIPNDPVSQIQRFIDSLPEVSPARPHIEARIRNLKFARKAIRSVINKVGFSDQVKLRKIDTDAEDEIAALQDVLSSFVDGSDLEYLAQQPKYRYHGVDYPGIERTAVVNKEFNRKMAEKAAVFVSELPDEMINDADAVAYAAMHYATCHNGDVDEFVKVVEDLRQRQAGD